VTLKAIDDGMMNQNSFPLSESGTLFLNDKRSALFDLALSRGEGVRAANGAFCATTGQHTGRSANDKYIVKSAATNDTIWWDNNAPLAPEKFDLLKEDFL